MKGTGLTLAFLTSVTSVTAHATFQQLWVNDVDQDTKCVRTVSNNNPVEDPTSQDMVCNVGAAAASGVCEAEGGQTMSVEMHEQPGDRDCGSEAIGGNHFGPVMVYMSKVEDAAAADGSDPWFKVSEFGYEGGTWGTDTLNDNCGKHTFTVPSKIPAGDYLVRAEVIALHTAGQQGGAQFYMSCYQVKITSSGDQLPAGVQIPGAYSASDPGILVDIWGNDFDSYTIPGPDVIDESFF